VAARMAPRPNQLGAAVATTSSQSDTLNRLTQKLYSGMSSPATTSVTYGYDGVAPSGCTPPSLMDSNPIGHRTSMCDGAGATSWSHDKMGRIAIEKRTTAGVTKSATYTHNLDGSVASVIYPSGRTINYTYASAGVSAGRLVSAVDPSGPINYVTGAKYFPPGEASTYTNGTSITNSD